MRKLATFAYTFALGTALYQYLLTPQTILWGIPPVLALLLAGTLGRRLWRRRLWIMAWAMAAGLVWSGAYDLWISGPIRAWAGQNLLVTAEVTDYCQLTGSGSRRIPVRLAGEGGPRCAALWYGDEALEALAPGDIVTAQVFLQDAGEIRGESLRTFTAKGVLLLLYPRGTVETNLGNHPLRYLPQRLAHWMEAQIAALYSPEEAAFMTAMLLGDRSGFSETQSSDFSEVGLYHITSVSGLHCGYLLMGTAFLVGRHRRKQLAAVGIPLLLFYMVLVGCSASVVRATIIQIFCLTAPLLGRPEDRLTSLGAAMLASLLWNPMAVAGVGFQLTFSSMFGILCLSPRIFRFLGGDRRGSLGRTLLGTVAGSLAASIATAPFCALYFNSLVLISPLSNLLVFPAAALTFIGGMLSLALGAALPSLSWLWSLIPGLGASWILWVAQALARVPYHAVYFTNRYLKYWLGYVFLLFTFCALTSKARRKYFLAGALSLLTLVAVLGLPAREVYGQLHVTALNVGQGASAILSSEGETALVDCGSSNSFMDAGDIAADTLAAYGYNYLDYLILTHYHADHANGLEVLLSRTEVGRMLLPSIEQEDGLRERVLALAENYGIEVAYVLEEESFPLGEASVRIYPPLGSGGANEEGLTILCTAGDFDVLITGDMDADTERRLIETYELPDIEVLLAGHHGSKYSTSQELLENTLPEVGIISVGSNSYGHPTKEAMDRMREQGMSLYRTDLQGSISIVIK